MSSFTHPSTGKKITYDAVRKAMKGEPYRMTLKGGDRHVVQRAVNDHVIDSHLEACNSPDRGDRYEWERGSLVCVVSEESLPVLLRRLCEIGDEATDEGSEADSLAADILTSLKIRGY